VLLHNFAFFDHLNARVYENITHILLWKNLEWSLYWNFLCRVDGVDNGEHSRCTDKERVQRSGEERGGK